jgi:surfeit locus 1 family protein
MRIGLVPTAAAIAVVALTVSLGNWQVRRAGEKAGLQQLHDRAVAGEPIDLSATDIEQHAPVGSRVAAVGLLQSGYTVYIDNRTRKGVAGLHVVTPIRLHGSNMHVLVLRGWVASDPADRTRLPEVGNLPSEVRLLGIAESSPAQAIALGTDPVPGPNDRLWQQFSIEKFRQWSGLRIAGFIVRQESDAADGLIREWPNPGGDVDRHRAYAFQWYAMAAVTAVLWGWFSFGRPRRRAG